MLKLLEENIICNQFKHLEKEHSTYLNTLIQDLGDTMFICAVTGIMRFLYNRKEIVSFNVKTRTYRFFEDLIICTKCYTP